VYVRFDGEKNWLYKIDYAKNWFLKIKLFIFGYILNWKKNW
jgi:hypothetical protein